MPKKLFLTAFFLLASLVSTNGSAYHGSRGGHDHSSGLKEKYFEKCHFFMKHREEIGLTEEQLQRLQAKKFEVKRVLIETESQKDLAMLGIYQELHSSKPNVEKINAALDKKIEAKRIASKAIIDALLDAKGVLTPEQEAKSKDLYWKDKSSKSSHCSVCAKKGHKGHR